MDRATAIFVDGMGAAAATSGILSQLQGRIFALLYLRDGPVALEEIASELEQSKSNVSVNIRGLVDWHLVRRTRVGGSRKDHYEAATDFWRVLQEIMERRFRWNLRQVVAAAVETEQAIVASTPRGADATERAAFIAQRMTIMSGFFTAVAVGLGGSGRGEAFAPQPLQKAVVKVPVEDGRSATERRPSGRGRRR